MISVLPNQFHHDALALGDQLEDAEVNHPTQNEMGFLAQINQVELIRR